MKKIIMLISYLNFQNTKFELLQQALILDKVFIVRGLWGMHGRVYDCGSTGRIMVTVKNQN
jgi:hypothetical protein